MKRLYQSFVLLVISMTIICAFSCAAEQAGGYGISKKQPIAIGEIVSKGGMRSMGNWDDYVDISYVYQGIDNGKVLFKRELYPSNSSEDIKRRLNIYPESPSATLNDKDQTVMQLDTMDNFKLLVTVVDKQKRITANRVLNKEDLVSPVYYKEFAIGEQIPDLGKGMMPSEKNKILYIRYVYKGVENGKVKIGYVQNYMLYVPRQNEWKPDQEEVMLLPLDSKKQAILSTKDGKKFAITVYDDLNCVAIEES